MNQLPLHRKIPFKLSFILFVLVLTLTVLSEVIAYYCVQNEVLGRLNQEQELQARHIARSIDSKIKTRVQFVRSLATILTPKQLDSPALLGEVLSRYDKLTNFFKMGLVVIRADGSGILAQSREMPGRANLAFYDSKWFVRAQKESGVVISRPFRGRDSNAPIIVLASSIRNKDRELLGVLAVPLVLNDREFLGDVDINSYKDHTDILVVSRPDLMFVAATPKNMVFKPTPKAGKNLLHDRAMAGFNGVGRTINAFGNEDISAIADMQTQNWFVVVRSSAKVVFAPMRERFLRDILSGMFLVTVLSVTIFIALYVYFRPLELGSREVRKMKDSQNLVRLPFKREDEIGDLIDGFNNLVDEVNIRTDELKQANEHLNGLANIDGLTKVFNRRWFDLYLEKVWRVHMRNRRPLSLIIVDIDFFKKYNDTYGHLAGDECLTEIAQALSKKLKRPMDIFARYGGEEFAAIVDNDEAGALKLAELMRTRVEDLQIKSTGSSYQVVTISLGVASVIPERDTPPSTLIAKADQALYRSKKLGRNRVEVYSPENK